MDVPDPDIRLLTADNLDGAFTLSATAGWNQRYDDWRMLLEIAPGGSFAAVLDDTIAGTAIGIDYGTFGWIAMMLVDPKFRSRGIGAQLLEAAIGALPPDLPIRLDATPLGRPLYQRYGFEDRSMLTRYVRAAGDAATADDEDAARSPAAVRRLTLDDLPAVAHQDGLVFGGTRRVVVEWAFHGAPHYAHAIAADGADGARQFCLGREGRLFDQIGPVVAADDRSACGLVGAALDASRERAMVVDAFDANPRFTSWIQARGFKPQRPLYRMERPAAEPREAAAADRPAAGTHEFSILGPEFG